MSAVNSGIYKITNTITKEIYIGKTNNFIRRWKDHQRLAITPNHKEYNKILYQSMRKYGISNFTFEIIEYIPLEKYKEVSGSREQYWISYYDSYNNGYNASIGGDGGSEPGHCLGVLNGRALLTEKDIITIRTNYQNGMSLGDCYDLYKNKITYASFGKIWRGESYSNIMPEVYTKENIKRNLYLGRSKKSAENSKFTRKLTEDEVRNIRQQRKQGKKPSDVYQNYTNISRHTFNKVWYNQTYKGVI